MAATSSTGKVSPTWVRQTRDYFLQFLHATRFPPVARHGQRGQTFESPEWVSMLIGVLAVKCNERTYLAFTAGLVGSGTSSGGGRSGCPRFQRVNGAHR
jgi:hypothetical protein